MPEDFFNPAEDSNGPKVYVGAHVPLKLYVLLTEEAERTKATRSDVIRWALAERYRKQVEEAGCKTRTRSRTYE
jgi:hypothetical protein